MTRKEKIASFKVRQISNPPATRFIPVNGPRRHCLYGSSIHHERYIIPSYSKFNRRNMQKEDLYLLTEPWWMSFEYMGKGYALFVDPGAVYDVASVPKAFVHGGLTKRGQAIQEPALVHDCLFALHLGFSFEDANNIFRGMIDYIGLSNRLVSNLYMAVRGRTGCSIYENSDTKNHWLKDYVTLQEDTEYEKVYFGGFGYGKR